MKPSIGLIILVLCLIYIAAIGNAKDETVKTQIIEYQTNGVAMRGYLAYPAEMKGPRPGILVFHEWYGLNDYARRRAKELAGLGYVALAADMYGDGKTAGDNQEATSLAGALKAGDRSEMYKRAAAALAALRRVEYVDRNRVAAIGYCFGGTVALELARGGGDLRGVVSFHGGLDTPHPAAAGTIRAAILACHGADDPTMTKAVVDAFQDEMRQAAGDWQMIFYGGAVHSFTNPESGNDKTKGVAYNQRAERRSWQLMRAFFRELFGETDI